MTYFTALDVSLRSISICIVDDTGDVRYEAKIPAEIPRIIACLR
jgi:transposase